MKFYSAVLTGVCLCGMYATASQQPPEKGRKQTEEPAGNVLFQYLQEKFGGQKLTGAQPPQKKASSKRSVYRKKR